MHDLTVEMEEPKNPDKYSVTVNPVINVNTASEDLETILFRKADTGKIAFQFTFEKAKDSSVAKRFFHIVQRNCHGGAIKETMIEPKEVGASSKNGPTK